MKIPYHIIGALVLAFLVAFGSYASESLPGEEAGKGPDKTAENAQVETEAEEESESFWEWEIGFVVGVGRAAMGSLNQSKQGNIIHEPWLSGGYYNGNFFAETDPANGKPLTIGYTGYESDKLQVNFIATPFFLGLNESNQRRGDMLTGIKGRKTSLDGGIEVLSSHYFGQIGFRALHDLTGTHKGFALSGAYSYPIYLDKMVIWPSVSMTLISSRPTAYYYGIDADETRIDRPFYQPDSGIFTKLNLYAEYQLTERTSLIGFSHYTLLNAQLHRSPLFTHNSSFSMGMGMIWTF